jgi:hypothetical protein
MRLSDILMEMIVRYDDPNDANPHIIAHRDSVWVTSYDNTNRKLLADIRARTGVAGKTFGEMLDHIGNYRPDVIRGTVNRNDGTLYLSGAVADVNSRTNPLVRKVMQALGLTTLEIERVGYNGDEYTDQFDVSAVPGNIPDIVFHGTNSKYISSILRVGIRPTKNANWANIGKFADKVFLTASFDNAMFHAMRQAEKLKAHPIIIATKIPDRARITRDFDVAAQYYGKDALSGREGYSNSMKATAPYHKKTVSAVKKHSAGTDFTRATGIMGYRGSIPPTNFTTMYVPGTSADDVPIAHDQFVEVEPKDFWKALDMLSDFDYYDPTYEHEVDDEPVEDED